MPRHEQDAVAPCGWRRAVMEDLKRAEATMSAAFLAVLAATDTAGRWPEVLQRFGCEQAQAAAGRAARRRTARRGRTKASCKSKPSRQEIPLLSHATDHRPGTPLSGPGHGTAVAGASSSTYCPARPRQPSAARYTNAPQR